MAEVGPVGVEACALCAATGGELVPCLGCETRAHDACLVKLGCQTPECPLIGMRGEAMMPQPSRVWQAGRWAWLLVTACVVAALLRRQAQHVVSGDSLKQLFLGAVAAALALTAMAFARDRGTRSGRVLARELEGRTGMCLALLLVVAGLWAKNGEAIVAGYLAGLLAAVWNQCRRGRKTHHPLRRSMSMLDIYVALSCILVLVAIGGPGYWAAKQRATTRACYANQKTILGAMEMFGLDRNHKTGQPLRPPLAELRAGGYLQSIPQDPGEGPGTEDHYRLTDEEAGITCEVHGAIQ